MSQHVIRTRAVNTDEPYIEGTVFVQWECSCSMRGAPRRYTSAPEQHEAVRDAVYAEALREHPEGTPYGSKREARTAAALSTMVDMSNRERSTAIAVELRMLADKAWALRARVVDFRGIKATYVISSEAFRLLAAHNVDIGFGPAFEARPDWQPGQQPFGTLFGTPIIADMPDSRHENVSLILDAENLDVAERTEVDTSKIRGLDLGTDDAS